MSLMRRWGSRAARLYYRVTAIKPSHRPAGVGAPVVVGFLRSASGIGASGRLCFETLAGLGLKPGYIDLSRRFQPAGMLPGFEAGRAVDAGKGPLIVHCNPPELAAVMSYLDADFVRDRLIVGYWAWELEEIPKSWQGGFDYVHEIWVPTRFVADAVLRRTELPVHIVPHPLVARTVSRDRAPLSLSDNQFCVLTVADCRSSLARKNLSGSVEAFRCAREASKDWRLIVKLGAVESLPDGLRREVSEFLSDPDITVITEVLSENSMAALYAAADVVLSLHRAEGFGLVPAEGLLHGRAVVATDWSGTQDFLTPDVACLVPSKRVPVEDPQGIYRIGHWADPDIQAAATWLKVLSGDAPLREALGDRAQVHGRHVFSPTRWLDSTSARFREHLVAETSE